MFQSFNVTLDGGNAAMSTVDDIADALRKIADTLEKDYWEQQSPPISSYIRDVNGSIVGEWTLMFKSRGEVS